MDFTAGWYLDLDIEVETEGSDCTIPFAGSGPTPPSCDPVTVNINGAFIGSPQAGATYNISIVNTDGTDIGTIISTGNTSGSIEIDDSIISINSTLIVNNPAEVDLDITVEDTTGAQVGSWNGTEWVVPAAGSNATININSEFVTTVAPGGIANLNVINTAGSPVGDLITSGDWEIGNVEWTDSDGSSESTVYGDPIVCTPASYGTRVITVLKRQYGVCARMGYSLVYLDDDWATAGNDVIRVRRSGDNAELDFTPTEITDGTLSAWVIAGGGSEDGFITEWYDQTNNGYVMGQITAAAQMRIVTSGVLEVDVNGNPNGVLTSTLGYNFGAPAGTRSLSLVNGDGGLWAVYYRNTTNSISRVFNISGNPAIGVADSTGNPTDVGTGTPTTYVNGTALTSEIRSELLSQTNGTQSITTIENAGWSDNSNWSEANGSTAFLSFIAGGKVSEFVLFNEDISTVVSYINSDRNAYYGYY